MENKRCATVLQVVEEMPQLKLVQEQQSQDKD